MERRDNLNRAHWGMSGKTRQILHRGSLHQKGRTSEQANERRDVAEIESLGSSLSLSLSLSLRDSQRQKSSRLVFRDGLWSADAIFPLNECPPPPVLLLLGFCSSSVCLISPRGEGTDASPSNLVWLGRICFLHLFDLGERKTHV